MATRGLIFNFRYVIQENKIKKKEEKQNTIFSVSFFFSVNDLEINPRHDGAVPKPYTKLILRSI